MKTVFISNIPSPYQVNFCNVISSYMDITFLFCDTITDDRPAYWNIELGEHCKILDKRKRLTFGKLRYINLDIWQVLNKINPDIIMIGGFTIPTNLLAYYWGRIHHKKTVVFTEVSVHPEKIRIYRFLFSRLNAVLAVGKKAQLQYQEYFMKAKVHNYSYAGAVEERFSIMRSGEYKEIRFLYASRYIERNNPLILIKAFAQLKKKYNKVYLTMSSNGPLREQCGNLVDDLQLGNSIKFWDDFKSWDEVNELYASSDILVFPSSFNSWGLVIPEAMAAGMPVITTYYVHGSELLDKMSLVEPNIEDIVRAMEYYILNPSEILKHGIENRIKSRSETYNEKAKQLKSIFEELLAEEK